MNGARRSPRRRLPSAQRALAAMKMLIVGATLMLLNACSREAPDSPFARDGAAAAAIVTTLSKTRTPTVVLPPFANLRAAGCGVDRRSLRILPALFFAWANLQRMDRRRGPCVGPVPCRRRTATGFLVQGGRSRVISHARRYGSTVALSYRKRRLFRPEILEWQPVYA